MTEYSMPLGLVPLLVWAVVVYVEFRLHHVCDHAKKDGDEVKRLKALLREWRDFCREAEAPLNACIGRSELHGAEYAGPNWGDILQRTDEELNDE